MSLLKGVVSFFLEVNETFLRLFLQQLDSIIILAMWLKGKICMYTSEEIV